MMYLRQGSVRPAVATAQKMLAGGITVDGYFGPRTKGRVESYQSGHTPPLGRDGIVGKNTWTALTADHDLVTIDVVDAHDPSAVTTEAADVRAAGGDPIVLYGQSNGVAVMVSEVIRRAGRHRRIALLRIHSHGAPGSMNITAGDEALDEHMTSLDLSTLWYTGPQLVTLAPYFVPWGSTELMGCDVGHGSAGTQLLNRVAGFLQVPVSAGKRTQFGGGHSTFVFEGPIKTDYPYGGSLKGWARAAAAR
jgi:hypothetical protein